MTDKKKIVITSALRTAIGSMGGALKAIEQGYQQQEIHTTAYRYFNEIERGSRRIVGINHNLVCHLYVYGTLEYFQMRQ